MKKKFSAPAIKASVLAVAGALCSFPALSDVSYHLDITNPEHHLANVTATFPKTTRSELDIKLPAWRTGRYEILDLANGITDFVVKDSKGRPLTWKKVEKSTWRVFLDKPDEITVSYQVYANQLGKRTRHVDDSHAYIDASGYFMYADEFRNDEVALTMNVPKDWRSVSGLPSGNKPHSFTAANFDVLVDSPIETGINQHATFEQDGRDYELVVWGKGNYDFEQMTADLKKLVATGHAIWDGYPYERYVFMVHATSGARGATEHLNSTIIQRDRYTFAPREKYLEFLSTASHEFIHTWNVKAYRPEGLVPYDYINPNYTNLLWLSEGSTSYFQNQLLLRAGLMTQKEFFKKLASQIHKNQHRPGRETQSVAQSSFDAWIGAHGDYGNNFNVNIYSEGYLVSWLLDATLLSESDNDVSYRDVHQALYENYRVPGSFNDSDMLNILKKLTDKDYSDWWAKNINQPVSLDFADLLERAGLTFNRGKDEKAVAVSGFTLSSRTKDNNIVRVERDSAAWKAGLTTDDKIVALDGLRLSSGTLDKRMKDFKPGQKVKVDYFRRDSLMTTWITFDEGFSKPASIKPVEKPTRKQKAFFKAWLGVDYPES